MLDLDDPSADGASVRTMFVEVLVVDGVLGVQHYGDHGLQKELKEDPKPIAVAVEKA